MPLSKSKVAKNCVYYRAGRMWNPHCGLLCNFIDRNEF